MAHRIRSVGLSGLTFCLLFSMPGAAAPAQCTGCLNASFGPDGRSFPAGVDARILASGDFNGDGIPDVAAAGYPGVSILLGDGAGSFRLAASYPVSGGPVQIAAADVNGDRRLDLIVALGNNPYVFPPELGVVIVLLGDGSGGFGAPQPVPSTDGPGQLTLADLNGDGTPDLILGSVGSPTIRIYPGNGSGGFGSPVSLPGDQYAPFLAADLDGDGIVDITAAHSTGYITIFSGKGDGTFLPGRDILVDAFQYGVSAFLSGDFNRDGFTDLALQGQSTSVILLGTGGGDFAPPTEPQVMSLLATGEFNQDGVLDIAGQGAVYLGDGLGGFYPGPRIPLPGGAGLVLDVDGDGRDDVLGVSGGFLSVARGVGSGRFEAVSGSATVSVWVQSLTAGDFNGDGKPDLVAKSSVEGFLIYLNNGDGSFAAPQGQGAFGPGNATTVATGDFTGDGKIDVVVADQNTPTAAVWVFPGDGSGKLGPGIQTLLSGSVAVSLVVADFNRDGKPDVALLMQGGIGVLLGNGSGSFGAPALIAAPLGTIAIAAADVNGDGKPDVAALVQDGLQGGMVQVYLGNGLGGFTAGKASPAGYPYPTTLLIEDLNGDGKPDVVVADYFEPSFLPGDGTGGFGPPTPIPGPLSLQELRTADFNGDGKADLAVSRAGDVEIFRANAGGQLVFAGAFPIPGPMSAAADFNGDGRPDIVGFVYEGPIWLLANTSCMPRRLALDNALASCATPGSPLPVQPVVRVVDDGDNTITCDTGLVTAAIAPGTGTPGAVLSGPTSVAALSGVATFTNLSINAAGGGYRLRFGHPVAAPAISRSFSQGLPPPAITLPPAVCTGGPDRIEAPVGYDTYLWALDGKTVGSVRVLTLPSLSPGDHSLRLDVTRDGCAAASTANFAAGNSPSAPSASSNSPVAFGGTLQLSATIFPQATYEWTGPNGFQSNNRTPAIADVTPENSGTYRVVVRVGGCASPAASVNVTVLPAPPCAGCARPSFASATRVLPTPLNGFAMAVRDFDGDGHPDVVVTTSAFSSTSLTFYPGDGKGRFGDGVETPLDLNGRVFIPADMNRDGVLDLVVSNLDVIRVVPGLGDGRFGKPVSIAAGFEPIGAAVGDFNEDGWPDIAVISGYEKTVSIVLGNGSGGFLPAVKYAQTFAPASITIGDFNGDRHLDVVITNPLSGAVSVLIGNGAGAFSAGPSSPTSNLPAVMATGDFDGDGKPDLIVGNTTTDPGTFKDLTFLKGQGDGTFRFVRTITTDFGRALRVSDVDGDGKDDVLFLATDLIAYLGRGGFDFTAPLAFPTTYSSSFDLGDLDHDGRLDAVALHGNFYFSFGYLTVLRGASPGLFETLPIVPAGTSTAAMISADFDRDGRPDLAVADNRTGKVSVLLNDGAGGFSSSSQLQEANGLRALVSADFNGDGIPDLAVTGDYSYGVSVYLGDGAGKFTGPIQYPQNGSAMAVGDLNRDGKKDIVLTRGFGDSVSILLGSGDGSFGSELPVTGGFTSPVSVAVGDFNGDGKDDLAVANVSPPSASVLLGNGDGTFGAPRTLSLPPSVTASSVARGDFNRDGKLDLAVGHDQISVFLGDGTGNFGAPLLVGPKGGMTSLTVGDWNGDGILDLAAVRPAAGDVHALVGDGTGGFGLDAAYLGGPSPGLLVAADFNADLRPDLAVGSPGYGDITFLMNSNCLPRRLALTSSPTCAAPGQPFPAAPAVQALDDGFNVVACDSRDATVAILPGTGVPGAVLGGTVTRPLVGGAASFPGLSIDRAGAGYVLQFESPTVQRVRSLPIGIHDPYSVGITPPSAVCSGRSAVFSADPGFDVYRWSVDGVFVGPGRTITLPGVSAGQHTFSVLASKDGCDATASVPIVVAATPAAPAASNNGPICPGDTLKLTAATVPNATYRWTGPNGFASTEQNPEIASVTTAARGLYSVTVTVGACESDPATTFASIYFPPNTTVRTSPSYCPNRAGNVASVLDAGPGASYSWSVTNGTITAGATNNAVTFTSGPTGFVGLSVTVTPGTGCAPQPGSLDVPIGDCVTEPEALAVDPAPGSYGDGNGILEQGEYAVVRPSWKNTGSNPLALTGTASGFTGNPGGFYALYDTSANYGSLPAGSVRDCGASPGDCYLAYVVTNLSKRPATHWDARFTETPSNGDAQKVWVLHIGESFTDVQRSHVFYPHIEKLLHNGVTTGCGPETYCPNDAVSRLQMAIFLARAQAGGDGNVPSSGNAQGNAYDCKAGGTSLFSDVAPENPFCRHVHYIYKTGVTTGCEPGKFCPDPNVTRAQMALFVARAVAGSDAAVPLTYGPDPVTGRSYSCNPATPNLHFPDVTTSDLFCRHTHYLWAKDVISGFPDNSYQPDLDVTRGALAKFLANGFNLKLYGP